MSGIAIYWYIKMKPFHILLLCFFISSCSDTRVVRIKSSDSTPLDSAIVVATEQAMLSKNRQVAKLTNKDGEVTFYLNGLVRYDVFQRPHYPYGISSSEKNIEIIIPDNYEPASRETSYLLDKNGPFLVSDFSLKLDITSYLKWYKTEVKKSNQ